MAGHAPSLHERAVWTSYVTVVGCSYGFVNRAGLHRASRCYGCRRCCSTGERAARCLPCRILLPVYRPHAPAFTRRAGRATPCACAACVSTSAAWFTGAAAAVCAPPLRVVTPVRLPRIADGTARSTHCCADIHGLRSFSRFTTCPPTTSTKAVAFLPWTFPLPVCVYWLLHRLPVIPAALLPYG